MDTEAGGSPVGNREIADFISSSSALVDSSNSDRLQTTEDTEAGGSPIGNRAVVDVISAASSVAERSKPRPWVRTMGLAVVLIALASVGSWPAVDISRRVPRLPSRERWPSTRIRPEPR